MQTVELEVIARNTGVKGDTKRLRNKGMVPANIYGPGIQNKFCAFSERELRSALKGDLGTNSILNLKAQDSALNGKKVILKNLEREPLSWKLTHADLYEIAMDRPLTVQIPFHYTGTPEGVKNDGGILQVIRRSVQIKALPADLPEFIEVDISGVGLAKSLHIRDVKFSDKFKVLDSGDFTIVAVVEAAEEEVAVVAAAAEGEGAAAAAGTGAATAAGTGTGAAAAAGTAAPAGDKKGDKKDAAKPAKG
jgi:large subunit ribosomal protein L25